MKLLLHLLNLTLLLPLIQDANGVAHEIRHCVTLDGKLRAFVQHLHGDTTPTTSDTLTLRDDTPGYGAPVQTVTPKGWLNNVLDVGSSLPGCASTVSDAVATCSYDDTLSYTACDEGADGTVEYLDRHKVGCLEDGHALQRWRLDPCPANEFRFQYNCARVPESVGAPVISCLPVAQGLTCPQTIHHFTLTGCNDVHEKTMAYLDRHDVTCPSHTPFLRGWEMSNYGCSGVSQRIAYQCCSAPPTDWVWYDFDNTLHVLAGGAIGGSYSLQTGNNMVNEGCPSLLPATLNHYDDAPDPETTETVKEQAWEKTRTETVSTWSEERMKKATPLPSFVITDPWRENRRELFQGKGLHKRENARKKEFFTVKNSRWVRDRERRDVNATGAGTAMSEASGRLLFLFGDVAASCSGTAVRDYQSSDRSLIVTAAHCIYDEKNKIFASHILFIPGIDQGGLSVSKRDCSYYKFGCWIPEFAVVDSEWASNVNDVPHDFGFLVVRNKGAHVGPGGRNLALEEAVQTVDFDWENKAALKKDDPIYTLGLPGTWSAELRYAKGSLKQGYGLQFTYGCSLVEGSSGGSMPIDPFAEVPKLFSVNAFKSGYWEGNDFIQTACGGPVITGNSMCALLQLSEEAEFGSAESVVNGGLIHPYEADSGCILPGWCDVDADCDDGIFCNGNETCVDNHCAQGTDPCNGLRCDMNNQTCLPPCVEDAECDDGIYCNGVETCVGGKCVAGPGNPCAYGEMCHPINDACAAAECSQASDCDPSHGLFCEGQGLCMDGQCYVIPTCEPDEKCDELSRTCELATCSLLKEQNFCLEDQFNECCICLSYCGIQEKEVIECAPFLFSPWYYGFGEDDSETSYLQAFEEYAVIASANLTSNVTEPSFDNPCLMWALFMDGIWGEKPKTIYD